MKITFIGDTHGKTPQLEWMLVNDPSIEEDLCFQVGDMGLGFKGVTLREYLIERLQFIRGNHDSPEVCRQHPNYAGDFRYYPEIGLFAVGGAWSIDWKWRTPGVSWWPDEELSAEELNKAYQLYCEVKPKYVVTHEAPECAVIRMLEGMAISFSDESAATSVHHDAAYKDYKKVLGRVNTRTSQVLQQMVEAHQPKEWVFGHYHLAKQFEFKETKFTCVPELAKYTLEVEA